MKLTKQRLKEIIKEELQLYADHHSQSINEAEQIISSRVQQITNMIEKLDDEDKMQLAKTLKNTEIAGMIASPI